jgi:phage terminase Nu1 subunit (DNA packaging protein)
VPDCVVFCPNDNKLDEQICPVCECNEETDNESVDEVYHEYLDENDEKIEKAKSNEDIHEAHQEDYVLTYRQKHLDEAQMKEKENEIEEENKENGCYGFFSCFSFYFTQPIANFFNRG